MLNLKSVHAEQSEPIQSDSLYMQGEINLFESDSLYARIEVNLSWLEVCTCTAKSTCLVCLYTKTVVNLS